MISLKEYKRVIGVSQLLFLAGKGLKRVGIKYTAVAAILGGGVVLVNVIGDKFLGGFALPVNNPKAVMFPIAVAICTFGLGNTLTGISNLFSSEKLLVADANAMNLLEDRKKVDLDDHLKILWDRVFKYEARLYNHETPESESARIRQHREKLKTSIEQWPDELKEHFGITAGNLDDFILYIAQFQPLSHSIEACHDGFVTSAGFALRAYLPQKLQTSLTGCDFSLLEDWYDGAYFTANDCRLKEQFAANKTLRAIRKKVGISWPVRIKETLSGHPDPIWHILTMKKIGTSAGVLINKFNKKYLERHEPQYFDAQDFLWNDPQCDEMILKRFPRSGTRLLADLYAERRKMIRSIFSERRSDAHIQIFRMFGRDFVNALNLRLSYDLEYTAGLLDYGPIDDIQETDRLMLCPTYPLEKARRKMARARHDLEIADAFLKKHLPQILDRPPDLRAARIGFYLDRFNLHKNIENNPQMAVKDFHDFIIPARDRYTQRLCLLRQHYELTRIQLASYVKMVDDLGEYHT